MFDNIIKILVHKREIRRISCIVVNMTANMPYNCEIINKNGESTKYCDIPDIAKYFIYKANLCDSEVRYDIENNKPYVVRCYYHI